MCTGTPEPMTSEIADHFSLQQAMDSMAADFTTAVRWKAHAPGTLASGVPADTSAHITIELGEPVFMRGVNIKDPTLPGCRDYIEVPARVEFETADGLLAGRADGSFTIYEDGAPSLWATAPLAEVSGTIELDGYFDHFEAEPMNPVDKTLPHIGDVRVIATVQPDGIRGFLEPRLVFFDDEQAARDFLDGKAELS